MLSALLALTHLFSHQSDYSKIRIISTFYEPREDEELAHVTQLAKQIPGLT